MGARLTRVCLGATAAVMVCLPALVGCHQRVYRETMVRSGIAAPEAPDWVTGDPQAALTAGDVVFVGRSVAYNVLDEPAAVAAAREDVYRQIAGLISTRVVAQARARNARWNAETQFPAKMDKRFRFLPGPEVQEAIAREAWLFTSCVAGDLVDRGVYFEQWDVRETNDDGIPCNAEDLGLIRYNRPFKCMKSRGLMRYKCWVRMSIPKEKLDARIEAFGKYVTDAYERYLDDRKRVIAWAQEDRELRIKREEEARQWIRHDVHADRLEATELRRIIGIDRVRFNVQAQ